MATENMNDGVGKKIVEALKMQTDDATDENMITEEEPEIEEGFEEDDDELLYADNFAESINNNKIESHKKEDFDINEVISYQRPLNRKVNSQPNIDTAFNNSLAQNLGEAYAPMPEDIEYPANVAILRQLIAKLPSGVSKQTGALIIKQTMEALGISMNSVLQEAKQVQEMLNTNSKECQRNIIEYRRQIGILESKTQQYQRQVAIMNDIINLFIHTGR